MPKSKGWSVSAYLKPTNDIHSLGRALIKFSTAVRNTVILVNGVSNPNLMRTAIIALGDLLALIMRREARLPLE